MNADQQMRDIVEKAGECWHDVTDFAGEVMGHYYFQCVKCKITDKLNGKFVDNPSPTDLNELFRLAEKLGFAYHVNNRVVKVLPENTSHWFREYHEADPADALRTAIWQAIQEVK